MNRILFLSIVMLMSFVLSACNKDGRQEAEDGHDHSAETKGHDHDHDHEAGEHDEENHAGHDHGDTHDHDHGNEKQGE